MDEARERALLRVLNRVQSHLPLEPRPFASVGEELGLSESMVLELLGEARERRLLRQLGAIFDAGGLGYSSSLVAARYPEAAIDEAARIIGDYPGVSHNYRRAHELNLWYTIATPPGEALDGVVATLSRLSGAERTLVLPTLRRFKLAVRLDVSGEGVAPEDLEASPALSPGPSGPGLDALAIGTVRALQDELALVPEPFAMAAERKGLDPAELLASARELHQSGVLRRVAATLRHREAGFKANGMGVWQATEEECDQAGPVMATFPEVTHCYRRPTGEGWPYSLFTMIHARTESEVVASMTRLSAATGLDRYDVLFSTTEFKKRRTRYFTDEWDEWKKRTAGR